MLVSLNQAGKIRRSLESFIQTEAHKMGYGRPNSIKVMALRGEKAIETEISLQRATNRAKTEGLMLAIRHMYDLRILIQEANLKEGIFRLLGEIAYRQTLLQRFNYAPRVEGFAVEDFKAMMGVMTNEQKVQLGQVAIYTDIDVQKFEEEIRDIKLEIKSLEDERNKRNFEAQVKLPDAMVAYLKDVKLL